MKTWIINRLKKVFNNYDTNSFLFGCYFTMILGNILRGDFYTALMMGWLYPIMCYLVINLGNQLRGIGK